MFFWGFLGHSRPLWGGGGRAPQAPLGSGTVDKEQKLLKVFNLDFNSAGVSNFSGGVPGFFGSMGSPYGWGIGFPYQPIFQTGSLYQGEVQQTNKQNLKIKRVK